MESNKHIFRNAVISFIIFTVICGVFYPLLVTGICHIAFKDKVNGSIIQIDGVKYGSELLAQQFTGEKYLWGRVMNTNFQTFYDEEGKALLYAGPSNLTPASEDYEALIAERVLQIKAAHPEKGDTPIPVDLVTASGSGLDPHISPAAAAYQIERIAKSRGISSEKVRGIVIKYTEQRLLGIFGEDTVNVLKVNLALDGLLQ